MELYWFEDPAHCMTCASTDLAATTCSQQHPGMHYVETAGDLAELIPHVHYLCRQCGARHSRVASELLAE